MHQLAETMSAKKYKLFKASGDGKAAPCAFFASLEGCKNGRKCKFLHEKKSAPEREVIAAVPKRDRSASVVSSESEGGGVPLPPTVTCANESGPEATGNMSKTPETKKTKEGGCLFFASKDGCKSGSKCRFSHELPLTPKGESESVTNKGGGSIDQANPCSVKPITSARAIGKKNRRSGDGDIFAAPKGTALSSSLRPAKKAKNSQIESPLLQKAQISKQPQFPLSHHHDMSSNGATKVEPPTGSAEPSFRQLNLPIAAFSIPGFQLKDPHTSNDSTHKSNVPNLPLPKSTPEGRKWQEAVIKTRENTRYPTVYDFQKLRDQDVANGSAMPSDWVKARSFGDWCRNNPQTIAIDCEMCETQDPVTGFKNHRALCRLSIVNGDNTDEVLLDTLVKPCWPVTDYRTWVNGIEKKHLENVEFTIRHAQEFLMALCSEETVILGHAVHNDLAAMRMEHHCVVDSSFLFDVKDEVDANPGLKDITKALLAIDMPKTHDSVNDALMAFRCLEVWLEKGGDVEPVERIKSTKNKLATSQLFIHRIPQICQKSHLETMFLNHTSIQPIDIQDFEFNGDIGKTMLTFASPRHANLAFSSLDGDQDQDSSGRLQKKVFLRNGGYIRVRKMVHERVNKKQGPVDESADKDKQT
jgi:RNA exonuclease 1